MNTLNEMRRLAGLAVLSEQVADQATGVTDVTATVAAVESPKKELPREVKTALTHMVDDSNEQGDKVSDANERAIKATVVAFGTELLNMLDGSEDGYKRAGQHLTSAASHITQQVPNVVVKYLSGNVVSGLNTDEINKEGIRKHLRAYVDDIRNA